jgi:hypothetical protein
MAEIINLRQMRKRKARAEKEAAAAANRTAHGVKKSERERLGAQKKLEERQLDQHRRDEPTDS